MTLSDESKATARQEDAYAHQDAAMGMNEHDAEEQAQQSSNKPIAVDIAKVWARADAWREKRKAEAASDTMAKRLKSMTLTEAPKVRIKLDGARKRPQVLQTIEFEDETKKAEEAEKDRFEQQEWRKRVAAEHELSPEEVKRTAAIWFGKRLV